MSDVQLTREEKRRLIAEACGWTKIQPCTCQNDPHKAVNPKTGAMEHLPDFFNSLDAIHEAEKVLVKDVSLYLDYGHRLQSIGALDALFSTSEQRAEAFGRTMSLW